MVEEKLIHIRLEYEDAIQFKKDILSSEMDLLRIIQTIKRYHKFRSEEFKLKIKLHRQIKTLLTEINRLQKNLPELKIPKILQSHKTKETFFKEPKQKKEYYDDDIEFQLKEIQEKLNSLDINNL